MAIVIKLCYTDSITSFEVRGGGMEKLQQDSAVKDLTQHQQAVGIAMESAKKEITAAPADNNPMATKLMASAMGGSIFSAAVMAREELSGKNSASLFTSPAKTGKPASMFLGGGSNTASRTKTRSSIVPMGYSEKKLAAKDNKKEIVARSTISGMSLTGTTTSGSGASPIKGAVVTPAMTKTLDIKWLEKELATVNRALQNPYASGTKRLLADLGKGVDNAERHVLNNPNALPPGPAAPH